MNAPHGKASAFGRRGSGASLPSWVLGLFGLALMTCALLLTPGVAGAGPGDVQGPTLSESFSATSVAKGGTVTMNFTFGNPNPDTPFDTSGFSDTLPAGLVLVDPTAATGTCLGSGPVMSGMGQGMGSGGIVTSSNPHQFTLSQVQQEPSTSCTLSLQVQGTISGQQTNTTDAPSASYLNGSQETTVNGQPASASVIVLGPPRLHLALAAHTRQVNGTTTLRVKIRNPAPNPIALTGVGVTAHLPANLKVASPSSPQNTCGGTWHATGSSTVTLSNGSIPAGTQCSMTVRVKATAQGLAKVTAGPVSSNNGGAGNSAQASMVVLLPPKISAAVHPAKVVSGHNTRVTFTISNPNSASGLNVLVFYVRLSKKLTVANHPDVVGQCFGGSFTATPGRGTMRFLNGQLPASGACRLSVTLHAEGRGQKLVETTRVAADNTVPGNRAVATLMVTAPPSTHSRNRH